ncbi:MAG: hypothetical protein ACKOZU_03855 [Planctomycetaceae bacterium]
MAAVFALSSAFAAAALPGMPADTGTSSREARRQAEAALPLDRMAAEPRALVERQVRGTSLYRRLPVATVACEPEFLDFVLSRPDTLVDLWRVLGISRLALDPAGAGRWRLSDGWGTVGAVRLVHHERRGAGGLFVFHGRGGYTGPLAPRDLSGSCIVLVRHWPVAADADGCPRQAVQVDAFLDVDGLGLEIVTRALQPLVVHSAASNLQEISLFVSQFARAAARNPAGVARLTERMSRTGIDDRRALAALAAGGGATGGAADDADQVHAELAARWLPADEIEAAGSH